MTRIHDNPVQTEQSTGVAPEQPNRDDPARARLLHDARLAASTLARRGRRQEVGDDGLSDLPAPPVAQRDPSLAARIESALCPYAWRRMTVRAVALRLHAERAAELQCRGQAGSKRQRLANQPRHHRMVVMARQQHLGQRAQAHEASAHRPAWQEERQHAARYHEVGDRRAAAVEEGWGIGHRRKIGIHEPCRYPGAGGLRYRRWSHLVPLDKA